MEGYQLREVAGTYWLIDMKQNPFQYKKPLEINEVGAFIWQKKVEGFKDTEIAKIMSEEYGVEVGELLDDIEGFNRQLKNFGVII